MKKTLLNLVALKLLLTQPIYAMHISEGYLTPGYSLMWWVFYLAFAFVGVRQLKKIEKNLNKKLLISLVGAFVFFISAMKLPSVTGSSSHATGIALGAILLGVSEMYVLGGIVLFFQAIFLAHGGITTLGANGMSMAVVGAITASFVYKQFMKHDKEKLGLFFAALFSNLATYSFTAFQLALSHGGTNILATFTKFLSLFFITQIPLGIVEGMITIIIIGVLKKENLIDNGGVVYE